MNVGIARGKENGLLFKQYREDVEIVQQAVVKYIINVQNREIMKNMFLILSIFLFITGCREEETKQQENSIYGQWSLIKYEPGLSPTENFNIGQIYWTFQSTNNLQVQVNNSVSTPPLKTTGEYDFSINGSRISIDDIEYDLSVNGNALIVSDSPSSDGFKITFSKEIE